MRTLSGPAWLGQTPTSEAHWLITPALLACGVNGMPPQVARRISQGRRSLLVPFSIRNQESQESGNGPTPRQRSLHLGHLAAQVTLRADLLRVGQSWFKAQHYSDSWTRMPSDFDLTKWLTNHTTFLNESRGTWERKGYSVLTEGQNHFNLKGNSAVLAGKPDLVASQG